MHERRETLGTPLNRIFVDYGYSIKDMARRKRGQPIHGWVIIDKSQGLQSTETTNRVRRAFDAQKAGHGGTLDPLATGVLAIALGEATKTVPYVMDGPKTYQFTVTFGARTSSDDSEGDVLETSDVRPSEADVRAAMAHFMGDIMQVPPKVSAIKVEGERAYDLARDGESFELAARPMTVYRLELLSYAPEAASFEVEATKGFYVRALARDIALECGTLGHVTSLRRLATGPFALDRAVSLEKLEQVGQEGDLFEYLADPIHALAGIPAVDLDPTEAVRIRNGNPVSLVRRSQIGRLGDIGPDDEVVVTVQGQLLALARFEAGQLQPIRVFNL